MNMNRRRRWGRNKLLMTKTNAFDTKSKMLFSKSTAARLQHLNDVTSTHKHTQCPPLPPCSPAPASKEILLLRFAHLLRHYPLIIILFTNNSAINRRLLQRYSLNSRFRNNLRRVLISNLLNQSRTKHE